MNSSLSPCAEQQLQQSHDLQQEELRALQHELQTQRQRREDEREERGQGDQETLALLTQQAEQTEESVRQLTVKLQEKVSTQHKVKKKSQRFRFPDVVTHKAEKMTIFPKKQRL